jgi:hypothetical protein
MQVTITDVCSDCTDDLEHCHGVAIVHLDGCSECVDDPGCDVVAEAHALAIACSEPGCCRAP